MIDCSKNTRRHQIYNQNSIDLITKHLVIWILPNNSNRFSLRGSLTHLFLFPFDPLKISENFWFSDVFRGRGVNNGKKWVKKFTKTLRLLEKFVPSLQKVILLHENLGPKWHNISEQCCSEFFKQQTLNSITWIHVSRISSVFVYFESDLYVFLLLNN